METRKEIALSKKAQGYNCAQSVICTYCDLFGIDEKQAFMLSEGFGGGMGGMQMTCGVVTAMFMMAGLKNSSANLSKPDSKISTYSLVKEMAQKFKDKNQSIICAELKGSITGKPLRSCNGCVEDACEIIESYLSQKETTDNIF